MSGKNASPESSDSTKCQADLPESPSFGPLICFAVKEEASFFHLIPPGKVLITGMGPANAERAVQGILRQIRPDLVLTCGFAGGLNPSLSVGTVLYSAKKSFPWTSGLNRAGAIAGTFHFADTVVTSTAEKESLWRSTKADAVEMESEAIHWLCRSQDIPSATVRAISDSAREDLPLDFNRLMTPDWRLHYGKLIWALSRHPNSLPGLLRLRRHTRSAARSLGAVLSQFRLNL